MANSAQLTSFIPYSTLGQFLPGFHNKLQIIVPSQVARATMLNNFTVNDDGNLAYSGCGPAKIAVTGLISLGGFIPNQIPPPPLPLDSGPKVRLNFFTQVGSQVGNISSVKITYYYPQFEWAATYQANTLDVFNFMPGDVITFWAYYDWIILPVAPVNPATFAVMVTKCNLSLTAFSSREVITRNTGIRDLATYLVAKTISVPIGFNNSALCLIGPLPEGPSLIEVRMNILEIKAYINATGSYAPLIVGINNYIYLAVNGNLIPQQLAYSFSGNQPFVTNGNTIFPSSLVTRLLVDIKKTDIISIVFNSSDVSVLDPSSPAGFSLLEEGELEMKLQFNVIYTEALYPQVSFRQRFDQSVEIPLESNDTVEFPLTDCKVDSSNFQLDEKNNLIYIGEHPSRFKYRAHFFTNNLVLNNSNSEVANVDLVNLGFAIGRNGAKPNNLVSVSQTYTSVEGTFSLPANNTVENAFEVLPGQRISLLVYANNAIYTTTPPIPGVVAKRPPAESSLTLTGRVVFVIE